MKSTIVAAILMCTASISHADCAHDQVEELLPIPRDTVGIMQESQLRGLANAAQSICKSSAADSWQAVVDVFRDKCGSVLPCKTSPM